MPSATAAAGEGVLHDFTQAIWERYETSPPSKRILVSVSGIPGAGKSTIAQRLSDYLNDMFFERRNLTCGRDTNIHTDLSNSAPYAFAVNVPMDGFHLSRAQLRAMPDPETAIHRRGAAFTYDSAGYRRLVEQLARPIDSLTPMIYAPAFDHATKDPVADSIKIGRQARIIILEGNYVNLDREPWSSVAKLFDLKLLVAVDRTVARERLVKRHIVSGLYKDEASARYRVESIDDLNAEDVLAYKVSGVLSINVDA